MKNIKVVRMEVPDDELLRAAVLLITILMKNGKKASEALSISANILT